MLEWSAWLMKNKGREEEKTRCNGIKMVNGKDELAMSFLQAPQCN